MTPLLDVRDLCVDYPSADADASAGGTIAAVRNVSLAVAARECLGVVGESGSGKTQAFMAVMGLLPPQARARGSARFDGEELLGASLQRINRVRGSALSMVFQDPMTALTPHLRVGVQLAEVLVAHRGASWREAERAASGALERVGVPEPRRRLRQYPHELSGGLRQRVMIAMALLCDPQLLIADEPTTALDVTVQAGILRELRGMKASMALVLISHDLAVVASMADRIAIMYAGRIVELAPSGILFAQPRHPYTALLLKCAPDLHAPRLERMPTLPGQPPAAGEVHLGCAFAPRCTRASEHCRTQRPELRALDGSQVACHHPATT